MQKSCRDALTSGSRGRGAYHLKTGKKNWEELAVALGSGSSGLISAFDALIMFMYLLMYLSLSSFLGAEGGEHVAHPHRVP